MTYFLALIAALIQTVPTGADKQDASVRLSSSTISAPGDLSEPQYRELVRCTLTRNRHAIEAWVDTRFQLGRGIDAVYRRVNGNSASFIDAFAGCFELRSGSFPFSLDRLARDWADNLGVSKEDPNTLERQLEREGRVYVTGLKGYVDCIRQKNSPEAIRSYLDADRASKAEAFIKITQNCSAAPGSNLTLSIPEIDRALTAP